MGKKGSRRKIIRYARWTSKVAFLLLFVAPITYFASAPPLPVYSVTFGRLGEPLLMVPYGQSVCSIETYAYAQIGPGAWLICPMGGILTLVTGFVDVTHFLAAVLALLLFLLPVLLLGNVFCGWVCPLGTIIDSFDIAVAKFARDLDAKRQERFQRSKEKEAAKNAPKKGVAACPTCPFPRFLNNRFGSSTANGIVLISVVGSAVLRFPIFCVVCPIGVVTRGMFHLKAWTTITGKMMPVIMELSIIPIVAVLLSMKEKRFFCRKLCPVGMTLNLVGSVSPLFKPSVQANRCVMKQCPQTCQDFHFDYCSACRVADGKACERVCPQGINILDGGSFARCIKCFECYVECEEGALQIEAVGTSEAYASLKRLLKKKN